MGPPGHVPRCIAPLALVVMLVWLCPLGLIAPLALLVPLALRGLIVPLALLALHGLIVLIVLIALFDQTVLLALFGLLVLFIPLLPPVRFGSAFHQHLQLKPVMASTLPAARSRVAHRCC